MGKETFRLRDVVRFERLNYFTNKLYQEIMNVNPSRESLPEHKSFPSSTDGNFVSCEPAWQKFLIPTFVFVWPFVYFWRQVIPFKGQYIPIGNDFKKWYYVYKIYLLDHLSHFHLPLWSPAEAAGFPFYSSPLTQTFYPLNLFLVIFYKLAGGYTRLDHQVFTILGISIFSLGLLFWLRQFNLNWRAVLFATLVMSVSFKMAEILRFPNAVHTAAWYPWILFAITKILHNHSVKKLTLYGLVLAFFLICFFTAGYPYYIYYSLLLFPPYLLLFLIPKLRHKFFVRQTIGLKSSLLTLLVSTMFSSFVCFPYLYKMNLLMKETVGRGGGDFQFSTNISSNFLDIIGSLIFPPIANPGGWFYFSSFGFFLIAIYFFRGLSGINFTHTNLPESEKNNKFSRYQDPWIIILFLVWIGTIIYITYGKNSALFIFLWKYMPNFSSLRYWNRMNIVLVPILGWLLALAYNHFEELISQNKNVINKRKASYFIIGLYIVILIFQYNVFTNKIYDKYWVWLFQHVASKDVLFIIFSSLAFLMIWVILNVTSKVNFQSPQILGIVLSCFLLFSTLDMRSVGANMWIYPSPLAIPTRYKLNTNKVNFESFTVPRIEPGTLSLSSAFSVGNRETKRFNWYLNRYVKFLENTEDQLIFRKKILGITDGRKLYFSKAIDYPTIEAFLEDATQFKSFIHMISYSGDELVLNVNVTTEGYLSFIDNWDSDWKATVDSKPTKIKLLFGTFKSVQIPPGKHRVIFAYRPRLFNFLLQKSRPKHIRRALSTE